MPVISNNVKEIISKHMKQIGHNGGVRRTAAQRAATRKAIKASAAARSRRSFAARCRAAGIGRTTVRWRLEHGWSERKALSKPVARQRRSR
jgi:hypothetical protein